jgi:hypothetical protein
VELVWARRQLVLAVRLALAPASGRRAFCFPIIIVCSSVVIPARYGDLFTQNVKQSNMINRPSGKCLVLPIEVLVL